MAKAVCTVEMTIEGDDILVRFKNGRIAQAAAPGVNDNGTPKKKGMVAHTGGFNPVDDLNYVSAMLMRKV